MKVLKVIVDEMPKSCIDTDNLEKSCRYLKYTHHYLCAANDRPIEPFCDPLVERPDWCPLEVGIPFVFPPSKEEFFEFLRRLKDKGLAIEFTFNVIESEDA